MIKEEELGVLEEKIEALNTKQNKVYKFLGCK